MVGNSLGRLTFDFSKMFHFTSTKMHSKTLRTLWGVTLPNVYESGSGGRSAYLNFVFEAKKSDGEFQAGCWR
jgi:hypothetical protein